MTLTRGKQMILLLSILINILMVTTSSFSQVGRYEATIPPEILAEYDQGIVTGNRPEFVTITQPMIWSLRSNPNLGADVYRLDMDVSELSSAQIKVIQNWVSSDYKVLLWGRQECVEYANLFEGFGGERQVYASEIRVNLAPHPVNTDCTNVRFESAVGHLVYFAQAPEKTEVIASAKKGVVAGMFPYGSGSVYFVSNSSNWKRGADKDRWTLNFYQWMLGLPVPGAAVTSPGSSTHKTKGSSASLVGIKVRAIPGSVREQVKQSMSWQAAMIGVEVSFVRQNSSAFQAGLREGMIISSIWANNKIGWTPTDSEAFENIMRERKKGENIRYTVWHKSSGNRIKPGYAGAEEAGKWYTGKLSFKL